MSFADDLRSRSAFNQSRDMNKENLDSIVQLIVSIVTSNCHEASERGLYCIEGFVEPDSYERTSTWLRPVSDYAMFFGSPELRRKAQKMQNVYHIHGARDITQPHKRTMKRKGMLCDLNDADAQYVADSVRAQLVGLGLTVRNSLVRFPDITETHIGGDLISREFTFFKELPTTYPNLLISVSW